ncbi:hypothetical protein Tco_0503995, partial [Tanacetum coccineum]
AASSARDAQGTPDQSAAQASISQVLADISRPRGLSIPGPIQSQPPQPQQPTQEPWRLQMTRRLLERFKLNGMQKKKGKG